MIKKSLIAVFRLVRSYPLFTFASLGALVALILILLHHQTIANWVLAVISLIAIVPLTVRMWRDVRSGRYGVDILATTAIATSVILQQYWAAIVVVIMLSGGESLEDFASRRARSELRDLLKHAPDHAHVVRKNKVMDVKASIVQPRDEIIIRPGEVVPVDAVILDGASSFDESSLTGESMPEAKEAGMQILSGSVNLEGEITARAIHATRDSQYQQIVRLVQSAAAHPAPFVRLADRYSIPFTILALTIGGVAWILSRDPIRFLDVLVVATPCPLILATPIALIAGMSRAARDGIIIKTGTALEKLAEAKVFAFDKTGTLTHGTPVVADVVAFSPFKKQEVLAYAAALEQSSNHVLARAILAEAEKKKLRLPKARHVREIAGRGLEAHLKNAELLVGRLGLLDECGVAMPRQFDFTSVTQTATYVAANGKLAGYITFHDELRHEAKSTLAALRQAGVKHTLMVTGDNQATAHAVAAETGISHVVAEALPADKLLAIDKLTDHPVVFVGDGVNDAPVLTAADVGIALGARGNTAASEAADIVIMKDDLRYVARAVALAQRSFRIATESIVVGISLSIILMLVFATGKFPPVAGAIVQEVVDVIVILNALRAHTPARARTHTKLRG